MRSAQYGTEGASSTKRTWDEAVFFSMKSVWTAPRVQFDPGFGVGIVGACLVALNPKYTFLSVEQGELDRNLAPSQMLLAAQHVIRPHAGWGLNGDVHVGILSVVHVLQTLKWEQKVKRQ